MKELLANDISSIKCLFNFDHKTDDMNILLSEFSHYITHSENDPYYFICLLDHYAKCRPNQPDVAISLKNCLYNSFPE